MEEPRSPIARILTVAAAAAGGLLLLVLVLLFTLDLAPLFRPAEAGVAKALGRTFTVTGEVHAVLLPRPGLRFEKVFIGNRAGGTRPDLLLADEVVVQLGLAGWVDTHVVASGLVINKATLTLEDTPSGPSWLLSRSGTRSHVLSDGLPFAVEVEPRTVAFNNVTLAVRAPWRATTSDIAIERATIERPVNGDSRLSVLGRLFGNPWQLTASIDEVDALIDGSPFRIEGEMNGMGAQIRLRGTASFAQNGRTELSGSGVMKDTGRAFAIRRLSTDAATPAQFAFDLKNDASVETASLVFNQLGNGDLRLDLSLRHNSRPELRGTVEASVLDLRALPPWTPALFAEDGKLSTAPINLTFLRDADIDVKFRARSMIWGTSQIGRLDVGLWSNNGIVAFGPIRIDGPRTDVSGDATIDVRGQPTVGINLHAMLADAALWVGDPSANQVDLTRVDAAIELYGSGNSFAELLGSAYGQTNLLVGPGNAGNGVAAELPGFIGNGLDRQSIKGFPFRCIISRFDVSGGKATSRALMIESAEAVTTGQGVVDFANETIDFTLAPRPKDPMSLGEARDFKLSGPLMSAGYEPINREIARGLSRLAGQAALSEGVDVLMPLLGSQSSLGNPCVQALLGTTPTIDPSATATLSP